MCEIRQNLCECRHPYPPLTHFTESLWFFNLQFLLQRTLHLTQCRVLIQWLFEQHWEGRDGELNGMLIFGWQEKISWIQQHSWQLMAQERQTFYCTESHLLWFLLSKTVHTTSFTQFQLVSCYHSNPSLPSSQLFLFYSSFLTSA